MLPSCFVIALDPVSIWQFQLQTRACPGQTKGKRTAPGGPRWRPLTSHHHLSAPHWYCSPAQHISFCPCLSAYGILVPRPGILPDPLAVKVQRPNRWTPRESPAHFSYPSSLLSLSFRSPSSSVWGFPGGSDGKESACNAGGRFNSWIRKIPWRREWQPTPVFLPGKSHGQRSRAGCRPWGHKESDSTEWWTLSSLYPLFLHPSLFSGMTQSPRAITEPSWWAIIVISRSKDIPVLRGW